MIPATNALSKEMTLASHPSKSVAHCPFLELPLHIRRQIYHKAGVPRGQLIDLNQYRESLKEYPLYNGLYNSSTHYLPLLSAISLLTVCRMVHDEVMRILYGENCFELTEYLHRPYLNICVLLSMGDAAIREMRFLTVRLRSESCVESCCGRLSDNCGRGTERCDYSHFHQRPFNDEKYKMDKILLGHWQAVCEQLRENVQPNKLCLYIICDCDRLSVAKRVVEPLLTLPPLKDLGLRFNMKYKNGLQILAKETVYALASPPKPSPPTSFRFLDLPKELQLCILKHTALVDPSIVHATPYGIYLNGSCETKGQVLAAQEFPDYAPSLGCFCRSAHSAFNYRCKCKNVWFPSALFLVSRAFNDAASQIFYGQNRFYMAVGSLEARREQPLRNGLSAIIFEMVPSSLRIFPKGSLHFLTSLTLSFAECETSVLEEILNDEEMSSSVSRLREPPNFLTSLVRSIIGLPKRNLTPAAALSQSWLDIINNLAKEANLPLLSLELHFWERYYVWNGGQQWGAPGTTFMRQREEETRIRSSYMKLIQPMTALRGLKNFHVHLAWETSGKGLDGRGEIEGEIERMIMGPDYDAWEHGKQTNALGSIITFSDDD